MIRKNRKELKVTSIYDKFDNQLIEEKSSIEGILIAWGLDLYSPVDDEPTTTFAANGMLELHWNYIGIG